MAQPQLPAFCRTRRPTTVAVTPSSLVGLRGLMVLGLLFQLSTLLLVLAGPVPPRPGIGTNTAFHSADTGGSSAIPLSDR
jgi:hypothetical protein